MPLIMINNALEHFSYSTLHTMLHPAQHIVQLLHNAVPSNACSCKLAAGNCVHSLTYCNAKHLVMFQPDFRATCF